MDRVEALSPDKQWKDISVVLMDSHGMRDINREYLSHDVPTDVISFGYDPVPGDGDGLSGEIFVNMEDAVVVGGRRTTTSPTKELALYIAHGLHHLSGAVDTDERRRRVMRRREKKWLLELHDSIEGLIPE